MAKAKVKQSASKVDMQERIDTFVKKLDEAEQKSKAYANTVGNELKFLKRHYPALRTRKNLLTRYKKALLEKGFHYKFESEKAKAVKKYPELLAVLSGKSAKAVIENINAHINGMDDKTTGSYDLLKKMMIAPRAYYLLKLPRGEVKTIVEADKKKVVDCKKSKIEVSRDAIKEAVEKGLKSGYMYRLAVALILCSGRRPVELFKNAQFKVASKDTLLFMGQAKQKGGAVKDEFEIPLVHVSAKEFMAAFEKFRKLTIARGYDKLTNVQLNGRLGKDLSSTARKVLQNDDITFYSCRGIYGQSVLESKHAKNMDTQVLLAKILGHDSDDLISAMSYESVILTDKAPSELKTKGAKKMKTVMPLGAEKGKKADKTKKEEKQESKRLKDLKKIDVSMMGRAVKGLHEWVLEHLNEHPEASLTQTYITKNRSTSRPAIKAYLELIGDLA